MSPFPFSRPPSPPAATVPPRPAGTPATPPPFARQPLVAIAVLVVIAAAHLAFDLAPLAVLVGMITGFYLLLYPLVSLVERLRGGRPRRRGYLALWLTGIAYVLVVMVPLYANIANRATIAKAQADARILASAVNMYSAHMGRLPRTLQDLNTTATNARGEVAGPFLSSNPRPPAGWSPYTYAPTPAGTFTISSQGEGTTVSVP